MNVIFISPHFPSHFYQFCDRLKTRGVSVLGIGDALFENISDECQRSLTEYQYVSSLEDYDQVYRKVAYYIFKYGRIDYVESENEYWLELDARIRSDFHIDTGPKIEDMAVMNHKSLMKQAYQRVGIPTARWKLITSLDEALKFASKVHYPVIVKPDKGVGATHTYKLNNDDEVKSFWQARDQEIQFIEEEYVPGHVETFDGITNSHKEILFCASQVLPGSLMDAVNLDQDVVSYCQAPDKDLYDAGEKLLKEFDTRNKFFHFEFFRLDQDKEGLGRKGDIIGLEVNMRAPGGYIPDKMNYAFETDVYTIWADSLIYDCCFMKSDFQYYITHIGRKNTISYQYSYEDIRNRYSHQIISETNVPDILAGEMGNHAFLLRASTHEEMIEQIQYILARKDTTKC